MLTIINHRKSHSLTMFDQKFTSFCCASLVLALELEDCPLASPPTVLFLDVLAGCIHGEAGDYPRYLYKRTHLQAEVVPQKAVASNMNSSDLRSHQALAPLYEENGTFRIV